MRFIDNDLLIKDVSTPTHAAHQVLVAVHGFGVNRADLLQRQGLYPAPPNESPILGLEVAGEVIGCGPAVTRWQLGDRVCGLVAGGGYAEKVVVNEQHLMAVPESMTMHTAAGLSEVFITAYQALVEIAAVQPGERVLIHAGASGVGLAAIQVARFLGADVAVTVSSAKKQSVCIAHGASLAINYTELDFVSELKTKWKQGADVIIDVVGGDYVNKNIEAANIDGRIVSLGCMAGRYAEQVDMVALLSKRISLMGSTLRNRSQQYKANLIRKFAAELLPAFSTKDLSVPLEGVFAATDIAAAHEQMAANQTAGKLIGYWT